MGALVDLLGKRYGLLTVIDKDKERKKSSWICLCDCGNKISIRAEYLKNGNRTSCGCVTRNVYDLKGKKYGRLLVLNRDSVKTGATYWLCLCDCGNTVSVDSVYLRNGMKTSCGCEKLEENNLVGKTFGKLKVTQRYGVYQGRLHWICDCECGTKDKLVSDTLLRHGKISSCGCAQLIASKARLIDMVGKKYGKLTVVSRDNTKKGEAYWICNCSCGTQNISIRGSKIRSGKVLSCGCLKKTSVKSEVNLIGRIFDKLTVVEKDSTKKGNFWLCNCLCGNTNVSVDSYSLLKGKKTNCGCESLKKSHKGFDLVGKTFGELTVVAKDMSKKSSSWLCNCSCGNTNISVQTSRLTKGIKISCGYVRGSHIPKSLDLSENTYGELVVVTKDVSKKGGYWLCNCSCGNTNVSIKASSLLKGKKTDCGCKKSIIGKTFGRLTVISKSDIVRPNGDRLLVCNCSCGKTNILKSRASLLSPRSNAVLSCGCYLREGHHLVNKEENRIFHIIKYLYGKLKVRNRRIGFSNADIISLEKFSELISKPCTYCGLEESDTSYDTYTYEHNYKDKDTFTKRKTSNVVFKHNGIDRIDSSKGYTEANCTTCCKYCNMAKMDMSVKEFRFWAEKTYQFFVEENNQTD